MYAFCLHDLRAVVRPYGVKEASRRLAVGYDILKNIMSDQGDVRYAEETLKDVLVKITAPNGEW